MTEPARIFVGTPIEIVSLNLAKPDRELGLGMLERTTAKPSLVVLDTDGEIAREVYGTAQRDGGEFVLRALNSLRDDTSGEYELDGDGYLTYDRDTGNVYYVHSCGETAEFRDLNGLIACVQLARLCTPMTDDLLVSQWSSVGSAIANSF